MIANSLTRTQRNRLFSLLTQLGWVDERDTIVPQFCDERTHHISELTEVEAQNMIEFLLKSVALHKGISEVFNKPDLVSDKISTLNTEGGKLRPNNSEAAVKMRRKILHLLGNLGYTLPPDGRFDYERIEQLIQNIGSNNPEKKRFNYLENDQYSKIITQIEQIQKKKYQKMK